MGQHVRCSCSLPASPSRRPVMEYVLQRGLDQLDRRVDHDPGDQQQGGPQPQQRRHRPSCGRGPRRRRARRPGAVRRRRAAGAGAVAVEPVAAPRRRRSSATVSRRSRPSSAGRRGWPSGRRRCRAPMFCWTASLTLSQVGSSVGVRCDVGQGVEVDLELRVGRERREAALGDRQEALGLDERVDLVLLVVQVVERLDGLLVARLLERHEVVGHAEGLRLAAILGRHRRDAVADLLVLVEVGRPAGRSPTTMPTLPDLNRLKRVGAVGPAGVVLGDLVVHRELLQERQRLDVLGRVDRPLAAGLPVAAVVEQSRSRTRPAPPPGRAASRSRCCRRRGPGASWRRPRTRPRSSAGWRSRPWRTCALL